MTFLGLLLLIGGAVCAYYGIQLNNDIEAQLNSLFGSGTTDPGTVWIVAGVVVAVIGLVVMVGAMKQRPVTTSKNEEQQNNDE